MTASSSGEREPDPLEPEQQPPRERPSHAEPQSRGRDLDLEIMLGLDPELQGLSRQGGALNRVPLIRTGLMAFAVTAYYASITDVAGGLFLAVTFGGFLVIAIGQVANDMVEDARRMCRGIFIVAVALAVVFLAGAIIKPHMSANQAHGASSFTNEWPAP